MRTLHSGLLRKTLCAITYVALYFSVSAEAQTARVASPNQLTTPAERAEFCTRMREATTPEQRQAVVQKWHELMTSRAKEQGAEFSSDMGNHQPMMDHDGGLHMGMGMGCGPTVAGSGNSASPGVAGLPSAQGRGIAYVTGGVGEDEAAVMRAVASRCSMRARFTTSAGEFVSGVSVRVSAADGKLIFAAVSDGPYLYAKSPPGRYRLSATLNGVERSRSIDIPQHGGIHFP